MKVSITWKAYGTGMAMGGHVLDATVLSINFRDIAKSNTVNSLPHLDVHDILKGLSLPNHELRNGSYASTCMRKDCSPTSMVLVNRYGDLLVITGTASSLFSFTFITCHACQEDWTES
eukprot:765666-Hanusia_phi.AAC.2